MFFFLLTQDTMRRIVWGCWTKVTGSKAPPAFPAPYACIPSIVLQPPFLSLLPAAGSKAQALWSTRQPTPNIPESGPATTRQPLSLLHYVKMFVSHRLLGAKHKVFYCFISLTYVTSKTFAVLSLYGRGSCSLSLYSDDALSSLSTEGPVADTWTRVRCHASDRALPTT